MSSFDVQIGGPCPLCGIAAIDHTELTCEQAKEAQEQLRPKWRAAKVVNDLISERRVLQDLVRRALTLVDEPAGLTEEIIRDRRRFRQFFDEIHETQAAWIVEARSALNLPQTTKPTEVGLEVPDP